MGQRMKYELAVELRMFNYSTIIPNSLLESFYS